MEKLKLLVTHAQAGDLDAYGEIVRRFQDMAYGYAFSVLGDFHLAQDAAQEAFIQAYRELNKLRRPTAFPGWFRRIVFKYCDRVKRRREITEVSLEAVSPLASMAPGPAEQAEQAEMRDKVLDAIRSLPEHERTATTLFYIDGYSVNEIAEFLEVPAGTVKRHLHDSRKQLKERMIAMVSEKLHASKPGPDFALRVEEAISLQEDKQFVDAVRIHQSALDAAKDISARTRLHSYAELMSSYWHIDKYKEFAQGILSGLPSQPSVKQANWVARYLCKAGVAFVKAGEPKRAAELAERILELAEMRRGCADYRFLRGEGLLVQYTAHLKRDDHKEAARTLDKIHANLKAYPEEFRAACPGLHCMEDTEDKHLREWFRQVGNAYHNAACHIAFFSRRNKAEALRLMRRAAELRDMGPTHVFIAAWTLSVEGDREAALTSLKRAAEDPKWRLIKGLQGAFEELSDFDAVREDPQFLGVVGK